MRCINALGCLASPKGTAAPPSALLGGDLVQAGGISVKQCHQEISHVLPFPMHCPTSQTPSLFWAQVFIHTSALWALERVFDVGHVFQAVGSLN